MHVQPRRQHREQVFAGNVVNRNTWISLGVTDQIGDQHVARRQGCIQRARHAPVREPIDTAGKQAFRGARGIVRADPGNGDPAVPPAHALADAQAANAETVRFGGQRHHQAGTISGRVRIRHCGSAPAPSTGSSDCSRDT
jgi:hypothetical protein